MVSFQLELDLSEQGLMTPATPSPVRSESQPLRGTAPKFIPVLLTVVFIPK